MVSRHKPRSSITHSSSLVDSRFVSFKRMSEGGFGAASRPLPVAGFPEKDLVGRNVRVSRDVAR